MDSRVAELQRSRLLSAAIRVVEESGYAGATVAHITHRARVSRRTFYELFANREECFTAVLEDVMGQVESELQTADLQGLAWRERVRMGLWVILSFFDREPALARVCVVESLHGGVAVLERRERVLAGLAGVLDGGRGESARAGDCAPLTAEGLVGAAFSILYARLLRNERRPLTSLLGELMSMIVLPYQGAAAARREQTRPTPALAAATTADPRDARSTERDPFENVPMRLTYRTALVLEGIAQHAGASNREVAERSGIVDQGQVSKLLARLERIGLVVNRCAGHARGGSNSWILTEQGAQIAESVRAHAQYERQAA
jgi:AcrR family transcriptional regulator